MLSTKPSVCLVITSCGRMQLLKKTIESFGYFNTFKIDQVVFVEDSGYVVDGSWLANYLKIPVDIITVLTNEHNIGQFNSIDLAYSHVWTDYIFHLEDDWVFYAPNFIEDSLDIIKTDHKISCVWLRSINDTNNHPVDREINLTSNGIEFRYLNSNYLDKWSGFTFNPGLRKAEVMRLLMPFSKLDLLDKSLGDGRRITESDISMHFGRLGYRGAIPNSGTGYVRHIGYGYHIPQGFESKFRTFVRNKWARICSIGGDKAR